MKSVPFGKARYPAGLLAAGLALGAAQADGKPEITQLFKRPLASAEGLEVIVSRVDYPPGFTSPSHYHTGHVLVYVLEGTGAMEVDGAARSGGPGQLIEEMPDKVMVMRNESDRDWLRFVVFQVGPEGEPMIVRAD